MAQSNHRRPDSPAGDEERPACRTAGGASQSHRDLSAFAGHSLGATRLPVSATDEPRALETRVCVGQARS